MKYYIDACIWRDYFENRSDNFRPLGEWAFKLISSILRNKEFIVISDVLEDELKDSSSEKQLNDIFLLIPEQLVIRVKASDDQFVDARMLSRSLKTPFKDTLHAVISRDNGCIMVTRDKHFIELCEITVVKKPEDLI